MCPPINSRTKGASAERECARLIEEHLGIKAERHLVQTRNGGHDLLGVDGYAIEIKRYAKAGDADKARWWTQAVQQAKAVNQIPVVFFRLDRQPWKALVRMPGSYFDEDDFRGVAEIDFELMFALIRENLLTEEN